MDASLQRERVAYWLAEELGLDYAHQPEMPRSDAVTKLNPLGQIPVLTDGELERILEAARQAGALFCRYVLLRLPGEVAELFQAWLQEHAPGQAERVLNRIRECRRGELNSGRFGDRMAGSGHYAGLIAQRFRLAARRLGFEDGPELCCDAFRPPSDQRQLELFP